MMKVSLKLKSVYSTIAEDTMQNQALPTQKRQELLEKARQISQEPGVYLMKDAHAKVLYVGKAKNLRNRVTSYFKQIPHEQARIELMLTRVNDFDVLITSTENEALILENTLIKKYKTKFNVRLRDDKTYPYLKIKTHDLFPRLEWTRQVKKIDGVRYFGPFPSSFSARVIMEFLNHELRLRDCSDNSFRHRSRPCILYQMNQCTAPCVGMITPEQYRQDIQTVVEVLEGQSRALQALNDQIKSRMKVAAEQEAFEEAAQLRDLMKHLELVSTAQIAQMASSTKD
jgi:excinuclease ABC subunit C